MSAAAIAVSARVDGYRIDDWQRPACRDRSWVAATLARIELEGPRSSLGLEGAPSDRLRGSWYGPRLVQHVLRVLWHTAAAEARA